VGPWVLINTTWYKTGSRQKGSLNKATHAIKRLTQRYTEQAILVLAEVLANNSALAIARIRAAEVLLDRGPGRPGPSVRHVRPSLFPSILTPTMDKGEGIPNESRI